MPRWPDWRCDALDAQRGDVCQLPARWQRRPIARTEDVWLYCDQHRPPDAAPIPADAPFYVTRIDLRVALTCHPGRRAFVVEAAVRRLVGALAAMGGLVVRLRVVGGKPDTAAAEAPLGRLQLGGQPHPLDTPRSALWEAPSAPAEWGTRQTRRG